MGQQKAKEQNHSYQHRQDHSVVAARRPAAVNEFDGAESMISEKVKKHHQPQYRHQPHRQHDGIVAAKTTRRLQVQLLLA